MIHFIKFAAEQHIDKLQKEGQMYCGSIQYFAKVEDGIGRGDLYENVFEQFYSSSGTLSIKPEGSPDSEFKEYGVKDHSIRLMSEKHFVNIFCLYTLNLADYEVSKPFSIDEKIKEFGSHCLLIFDVERFLTRVETALSKTGYQWQYGMVKYIDLKKLTGKRALFEKPIELANQQEFRIAIQTQSTEPFELFIGNIEDISYKCSVQSLNDMKYEFR